ncbi:hypothetical protein JZ751_014596 [Albula glossodonta]|uniref:Uncharacterized protein n=1 Tax=Albula glossodonta TaxID=121402 RepID=A0A8T2N3T6_9TELE|nr:hypothetical protein JZ751_014596 [Albula glossodonta]
MPGPAKRHLLQSSVTEALTANHSHHGRAEGQRLHGLGELFCYVVQGSAELLSLQCFPFTDSATFIRCEAMLEKEGMKSLKHFGESFPDKCPV